MGWGGLVWRVIMCQAVFISRAIKSRGLEMDGGLDPTHQLCRGSRCMRHRRVGAALGGLHCYGGRWEIWMGNFQRGGFGGPSRRRQNILVHNDTVLYTNRQSQHTCHLPMPGIPTITPLKGHETCQTNDPLCIWLLGTFISHRTLA